MVGLDLVDSEVFGYMEFGLEGSGFVVAFRFQLLLVVLGVVEGGVASHGIGFENKV